MEGEEKDVEIIKPYEIKYTDLKLLSNHSNHNLSLSSLPPKKPEKDTNNIIRSLLENLGPTGPGLITVTGVPNTPILRRTLLPFARTLSLLHPVARKITLKEHGLGSDVSLKDPNRIVSSFSMQLNYSQGDDCNSYGTCHEEENHGIGENTDLKNLGTGDKSDLKNLGETFKELGFCMMDLGICLSRICDRALGGSDLENSLLESCMAKGRLIHYHSSLDNHILEEGGKRPPTNKKQITSCGINSNMWQQWHYDYGIFTVLTSPMFILPCHKQENEKVGKFCADCEQECPSPSRHTFLKIFNKNKNRAQMVKADPESIIIQVGEAAEILSKGKLRANLHSVSRFENNLELSRETFVVFLQPRWDKTLYISDSPIENTQFEVRDSERDILKGESGDNMLGQELYKLVPPLSSRLKDGMTFAEFSQETTKQYYGGRGLQSKK